ncbi:MAG TPA: lysylphosphatidylglycerol synthase transmembrane domain-containing protein, partial [Burkholderiales bacterium]|nr:lysylphosphatidylglycerol synthase transmembrane domain-containing protein [Burkholderiales bacterium]
FAQIGTMAARIDPMLFIGAITINIGTFFITATRWWLLLRHTGENVAWRQILPSYYLGLFFNNLLPTGVGGDVVRTVHLSRRGFDLKALAASMIMDRAVGLFVMVLAATACAAWISVIPLDDMVRRSALIVFSVCLGAAALAFSPWTGTLLKWFTRYVRNTRFRRGALESLMLCYSYRTDPALLVFAALLSLAAQSLAIFSYILLGRGIGLDLAPIAYFVVIPMVFMAAMLPISLGGLGVREGALVGLLILFGVDRQLAIGLSLLYLFSLWIATLPGAAVLLTHGRASGRAVNAKNAMRRVNS